MAALRSHKKNKTKRLLKKRNTPCPDVEIQKWNVKKTKKKRQVPQREADTNEFSVHSLLTDLV
jgi:hypothetical protein